MSKLNTMIRRASKDPLSPLVDRYFLERKGGPKPWTPPDGFYPRKPGRFSPSAMGGCFRRAAFSFMGVQPQIKHPPELQMIFHVGDWTHWGWFSIFLHMEQVLGPSVFRVIGIEQPAVLAKYFIAGRFDVLVEVRGVKILIDLKTINDQGFQRLMHSRTPSPDHRDQLMRYLRSLKVKHGAVMYLNKNDQRFKVFMVDYDKEAWKPHVRWLNEAISYITGRELPPKHEECYKGSYMMKGCPFAYLCYPARSKTELKRLLYDGRGTIEEMWEAHA